MVRSTHGSTSVAGRRVRPAWNRLGECGGGEELPGSGGSLAGLLLEGDFEVDAVEGGGWPVGVGPADVVDVEHSGECGESGRYL